jgi:hypothetical protein
LDFIVVLIVLVALGAAGYFMFVRARSSPLGRRTETYVRSERGQSSGEPPREVTVETLRAGDAVSFWDGEDALVDCVLECEEVLSGRHTRWRWNLLRGGRMLEVAPDGNVLYGKGEVFHQGSATFEELTGEPAVGGVLKTFEARVRAGTLGSNPVFFKYQDLNLQLRSTGTFRATPLGPPPTAEVWRDVSDDPGQNTYFELDTPEGTQALGIWTTHVLLLIGEPLKQTDIRNLYAGSDESRSS